MSDPLEFEAKVGRLGDRGKTGAQIIELESAPGADDGNDGDWALVKGPGNDTTFYGPKADGAWPASGRSIRGAQGPAGPQGPQGDQGATGPQGSLGPQGPSGYRGWNPVMLPVLKEVDSEEVIVFQLIDWIGGLGDQPTAFIGQFVNAAGDGFTADPTAARQVDMFSGAAALISFSNSTAQLPSAPNTVQAAIEAMLSNGRLRVALAAPGQVVQEVVATRDVDDTTTDDGFVDTGLSAVITPKFSDSAIEAMCFAGNVQVARVAGSTTIRRGRMRLRNSTADVNGEPSHFGRDLASASEGGVSSLTPVVTHFRNAPGSASAQTIVLQFASSEETNVQVRTRGDQSSLKLIVREIRQ